MDRGPVKLVMWVAAHRYLARARFSSGDPFYNGIDVVGGGSARNDGDNPVASRGAEAIKQLIDVRHGGVHLGCHLVSVTLSTIATVRPSIGDIFMLVHFSD